MALSSALHVSISVSLHLSPAPFSCDVIILRNVLLFNRLNRFASTRPSIETILVGLSRWFCVIACINTVMTIVEITTNYTNQRRFVLVSKMCAIFRMFVFLNLKRIKNAAQIESVLLLHLNLNLYELIHWFRVF